MQMNTVHKILFVWNVSAAEIKGKNDVVSENVSNQGRMKTESYYT